MGITKKPEGADMRVGQRLVDCGRGFGAAGLEQASPVERVPQGDGVGIGGVHQNAEIDGTHRDQVGREAQRVKAEESHQ